MTMRHVIAAKPHSFSVISLYNSGQKQFQMGVIYCGEPEQAPHKWDCIVHVCMFACLVVLLQPLTVNFDGVQLLYLCTKIECT